MTVSPTLFLWDRISAMVLAVRLVPAAKVAAEGAGAAGAGVGVGLAADADGVADAAGRLGRGVVRAAGAGAGVLAVGRSFNSALVSTGASCRSRLRLSAVAVSPLSCPQAARAANVSAAIIVLDIYASLK
jgi:hypothetical protein